MATSIATRPELSVAHVTVERSAFRALSDVTFNVRGGALVGILGPNGAGKSTLFDVIAGVLPATKGKVDFHGALAYVPQKDSINWRFPATVMDVVMLGRSGGNPLRRPGRQDRELVRNSLDRVGLWDRRSSLMTELSGGQRQRVFIARALAQEANIVLLDEAFSGVDVGAQQEIVDVLRSLRDDGCIIMLATHDLSNLAERFDMVLCLHRHVCAWGPPVEAFTPEVLQELYGSHGMDFTQGHWHGRGMWHGHSHNMAEAETNGPA
ncbi:MAG: metal ABC transporter ATP-binding protein [Chloroflexi bacterium]|nr:metal ABC transporter ATP-binding protein [Chloroflexota bacterium]